MKKYLFILVPLLSVALASLLLFTSLDLKVFDLFQKTLPEEEMDTSILIIKVDDEALSHVGPFPWSRDVLADGILLLKEMGAEQVIFDLSYLDHRPEEVDRDYLQSEYPHLISENFQNLNIVTEQFIWDIEDGLVEKDDLSWYSDEILQYHNVIEADILEGLDRAYKDNDRYFANALDFFGDSYLTLSMVSSEIIHDETVSFDMSPYNVPLLEERCSLTSIENLNDNKTRNMIGIIPAIENLLEASNGAGFVNASPDKDGYRRRVDLLSRYNEQYYAQLILPALLKRIGDPELSVNNKEIIIENARIQGELLNFSIPRTNDGSIWIKWPQKEFKDYPQMSSWELIRYCRLEKMFIENLRNMRNSGFMDYWNEDYNPLEFYDNAEYIKTGIFEEGLDESGLDTDIYVEYKNLFFESAGNFLEEEFEKTILQAAGDNQELLDFISESFSVCRKQYQDLKRLREEVYLKTVNSFSIIGVADATSMTDTGQTLYEERFPNVGIHSALANMILNQDFLDDSSAIIPIILAFVFTLALSFYIQKFSTQHSLMAGFIMLFISVASIYLFFFIFRTYIGAVVPFTSVALTFLSLSIINFIVTLREKSFLRTAFSRYLSPDVIEEIIADPNKLNLGGEKKQLTAIFTDIQGFSGISEKMDPVDLVKMLNLYLSRMSDIILHFRGTIDKYEGDAIIAFFGAPVEMKNHAEQACRTAIMIKKAEEELNQYIAEEGICEQPLITRLGINTGEMIVGNMGTSNKMDYTVMGNSVNLAARLEGVNKRYRTKGILISEHTRNEIDNQFVLRKLDRVRVVGVQTPLRLFELLGLSENTKAEETKWLKLWDEALDYFENGHYSRAKEKFEKIQEIRKEDDTCSYYIEQSEGFLINPPAENWDGVFNLTEK